MFQITTAIRKIAKLTKRNRIVQGGTSASKTISILLLLIDKAQKDAAPTLTSVVSESVPHLKRGAMRDFEKIMKTQGYWKDSRWNATDFVYTFETDSKIEFFSSDNGDKLRGARRERLFINEANNVTFEAYQQLEMRTTEFCFIDYNPTNEFWVFTEVMAHRDDWEMLILTYRDNEALDARIVASIEQRRHNAQWWRVYGEGMLGESEERIYRGWVEIEEIPHEARLERRGLDFGYTNDPSALVDIYRYNGGFIFDENLYAKGQSNRQLADQVKASPEPNVLVIADSSEPKSIAELKEEHSVNVIGAIKGPGSVNTGIQFVQDQRCSYTRRSKNIKREYSNYCWLKDRDGKVTNVPEDGFNHAMDAIRYGLSTYKPATVLDSLELPEPEMQYPEIGI